MRGIWLKFGSGCPTVSSCHGHLRRCQSSRRLYPRVGLALRLDELCGDQVVKDLSRRTFGDVQGGCDIRRHGRTVLSDMALDSMLAVGQALGVRFRNFAGSLGRLSVSSNNRAEEGELGSERHLLDVANT